MGKYLQAQLLLNKIVGPDMIFVMMRVHDLFHPLLPEKPAQLLRGMGAPGIDEQTVHQVCRGPVEHGPIHLPPHLQLGNLIKVVNF